MEKSRAQSNLLIVCLILGLLVGQSTANFALCYGVCFADCTGQKKNVFHCAMKCLKDCILPTSLENRNDNTQGFCMLGCAHSLCTNFSTEEDLAVEKMESCVDSCSNTCNKI